MAVEPLNSALERVTHGGVRGMRDRTAPVGRQQDRGSESRPSMHCSLPQRMGLPIVRADCVRRETGEGFFPMF